MLTNPNLLSEISNSIKVGDIVTLLDNIISDFQIVDDIIENGRGYSYSFIKKTSHQITGDIHFIKKNLEELPPKIDKYCATLNDLALPLNNDLDTYISSEISLNGYGDNQTIEIQINEIYYELITALPSDFFTQNLAEEWKILNSYRCQIANEYQLLFNYKGCDKPIDSVFIKVAKQITIDSSILLSTFYFLPEEIAISTTLVVASVINNSFSYIYKFVHDFRNGLTLEQAFSANTAQYLIDVGLSLAPLGQKATDIRLTISSPKVGKFLNRHTIDFRKFKINTDEKKVLMKKFSQNLFEQSLIEIYDVKYAQTAKLTGSCNSNTSI